MSFILTMPKLSPTMEEGTIVRWLFSEGSRVDAGTVIFIVATDKASVEHEALDGGWLRQIIVPEGQPARVNQPVGLFTAIQTEAFEPYVAPAIKASALEISPSAISNTTAISPSASMMHQPNFQPEVPLESYHFPFGSGFVNKLRASPLAKKLAQDKGLDLQSVRGSGPHGRIVSKDLEKALPKNPYFSSSSETLLLPGSYHYDALTPMRKVIGKRLQESKSFIPHFYITQRIDAEAIGQLREQLKKHEIKISVNDLILRALALALKQMPEMNSGFDNVENALIRFDTVDIAVAVSVDGGLITPIVRHADCKSLVEIGSEVKELAKRAREGKLQPHEYKGGSFTLSNLGMYGVDQFQAIINPPQAAILAVGGISQVPVVRNGAIVPGEEMVVTLSADHRVIDGAQGAQFLVLMKKLLEHPAVLLLTPTHRPTHGPE